MELEKTLYRVHERLLSSKYTTRIMQISLIIFFTISMYGLLNFILLNLTREGKQQCINFHTDYTLQNETLYEVIISNDGGKPLLTMQLSSIRELITMDKQIREKHNYTLSQQTIPYSCYAENALDKLLMFSTNLETIFLNDVVSTLKTNIYAKNNETNETWVWLEKSLAVYQSRVNEPIFGKFVDIVLTFLKIYLGLFIQSAVASIYIKMTIICAPVFIVLMIDCMSVFGNREIQPQVLARAFPWIGQYLNLLHRNVRGKGNLLAAFFLMLVLFYFIYLSSIFIGTILLFYKSTPKGLDEDFFGLMAINEFLSMLFLRTRMSLYFVPKFIILYYFAYLYYIQFSCYGFFYLGFQIVFFLSLTTFAIFLYLFEIPGLTWSPLSPYTPTVDRPRCYYLPLFQMGWTNDIPQIWTMFYPLHGRRFFQIQNLAFVDRNFPLLNNVLQQDIEMQEIQNQQQPQV